MKKRNGRRAGDKIMVANQPAVRQPPRPVIKQAALDIERGLVDTDRGRQTNRLNKELKP